MFWNIYRLLRLSETNHNNLNWVTSNFSMETIHCRKCNKSDVVTFWCRECETNFCFSCMENHPMISCEICDYLFCFDCCTCRDCKTLSCEGKIQICENSECELRVCYKCAETQFCTTTPSSVVAVCKKCILSCDKCGNAAAPIYDSPARDHLKCYYCNVSICWKCPFDMLEFEGRNQCKHCQKREVHALRQYGKRLHLHLQVIQIIEDFCTT